MVAIEIVAESVAAIANSLRMKSKRDIPRFHPLARFVFLKNANLGALDVLAGAAIGAFSWVSARSLGMAMEVEGSTELMLVIENERS